MSVPTATAQVLPPGPGRASLQAVLSDLGPALLSVLAAPGGLDASVSDVVIHAADDPPSVHPGDVVLAIGAGSETDLSQVVATAGEAGASAVVTKCDSAMGEAVAAATREDHTVLLQVRPEVEWGYLYSLLRSAVAASATVGPATSTTEPGNLFALANAIAARCGGPIVIHDPRWQLLAYSTIDEAQLDDVRRGTIYYQHAPRRWIEQFRREGLIRRLWTGEVIAVGGEQHVGLGRRLGVAVRAGTEVLATIWLLEIDEPLDDAAARALRDGAELAALQLVRHRFDRDLRRRRRGELLAALLQGRGTPDVLADRLDLEPYGAFVVAGLEPRVEGEVERVLTSDRLLNEVAIYSDAYRLRVAEVLLDDVVYLLLPRTDAEDRATAVATLRELHDQLSQHTDHPLHLAIGRTVDRLDAAPRSRDDVDHVLQVLRRDTRWCGFATIDTVRAQVQVLRLRRLSSDHPDLLEGSVAALADLDREDGSSYVATLRAYFDASDNATAAAQRLGVHPNTLRYRIDRARQLTGLDLDDPEQRFVAEFQVRARPRHRT